MDLDKHMAIVINNKCCVALYTWNEKPCTRIPQSKQYYDMEKNQLKAEQRND